MERIVDTGRKLLALEYSAHATAVASVNTILTSLNLTHSARVTRACQQIAGSAAGIPWNHGLADDSLQLAQDAGWPDSQERARFDGAVGTCPLELVQVALWEGNAAGELGCGKPTCRILARYVVARRLHALLVSRRTQVPEFPVAAEILSEDLCRRFLPPVDFRPPSFRIVDTSAGEDLVRKLGEMLDRLSTKGKPPYLADALKLPPVHAYNTLRKRLRDYEIRKRRGKLHDIVLRLQREVRALLATPTGLRRVSLEGEEGTEIGAESLLAEPAEIPRTPPDTIREARRTAQAYFAKQDLLTQQILILKSLGLKKDVAVADVLDVARETVNRRLKGARETFRGWFGWSVLVPMSDWPEFPPAALQIVLDRLTGEYEYVHRYAASPGCPAEVMNILRRYLRPLTDDVVASIRDDLRSLRPGISEFKEAAAASEDLRSDDDLTIFDAQFVYVLGGFMGLTFELSHVNAALRIFVRLGADERWLLANAGAPEAEKVSHFGGEPEYARVRDTILKRRSQLESYVFPDMEHRWSDGRSPDGKLYFALQRHRVEGSQRTFDLEKVYEVLVFLANGNFNPY